MFSAAIFSLILPAIEMAENLQLSKLIVLIFGLLFGSLLIIIVDKIFTKMAEMVYENLIDEKETLKLNKIPAIV